MEKLKIILFLIIGAIIIFLVSNLFKDVKNLNDIESKSNLNINKSNLEKEDNSNSNAINGNEKDSNLNKNDNLSSNEAGSGGGSSSSSGGGSSIGQNEENLSSIEEIKKILPEYYCTNESRSVVECDEPEDFVCGWYNSTEIECGNIDRPCVKRFPNKCLACIDQKVMHWTQDECPIHEITLS